MPRPAPSDEELIPPLTVPEVIAAIQPASQATPLGQASGFYRNREGSTAQPGTPAQRLQDQIERAGTLQRPASPRQPGEKCAASQEPDRPSESARSSDQVVVDVEAPL